MRVIIIVLFYFILSFEANAQSLSIDGNVETLVGNVYASRYSRTDAKGRFCGVLLVHSTIKNLEFSGDTIGDVKYKSGVYYVYLRPKTTKLNISDPDGASLRLELPKIQPKTTYEITIYKPEERGVLQCDSDPSGAMITLLFKDHRIELGRTPLRGSHAEVLTGIYNIEISKKGYSTRVIDNVKIKRDKTTKLGMIKLNTL